MVEGRSAGYGRAALGRAGHSSRRQPRGRVRQGGPALPMGEGIRGRRGRPLRVAAAIPASRSFLVGDQANPGPAGHQKVAPAPTRTAPYEGYPDSIAVIGHSTAAGYHSDPNDLSATVRENSWADRNQPRRQQRLSSESWRSIPRSRTTASISPKSMQAWASPGTRPRKRSLTASTRPRRDAGPRLRHRAARQMRTHSPFSGVRWWARCRASSSTHPRQRSSCSASSAARPP